MCQNLSYIAAFLEDEGTFGNNESLVVRYQTYKSVKKKKQVMGDITKQMGRLIIERVLFLLKTQFKIHNPIPQLVQMCFQEGSIGLAKAVSSYNSELGFKFSTYAVYYIDHEIRRCIVKEMELVHYPVWTHERGYEFNKKKFAKRKMSKATEIALSTKETHHYSSRYLSIVAKPSSGSLNGETPDTYSVFEESLGCSNSNKAEMYCLAKQVYSILKKECTSREVFILERLFCYGETLNQIGEKLNLTRERVNQLKVRALEILSKKTKLQEDEIVVGISFMANMI